MIASHNQCMRWSKALALAVPAWIVVCGAMVAINYAADARATLLDLSLALLAAYPLIAFLIKATAGDWAKWRAGHGCGTDENERR